MAFDWLMGIAANIFSSAIWDGTKRIFGARENEQVLSLGLQQPASSIRPPGPGRQAADFATLERIQRYEIPGEWEKDVIHRLISPIRLFLYRDDDCRLREDI